MVKPIHPKPVNDGEVLNEVLGYPGKVQRTQLSRAIEPPLPPIKVVKTRAVRTMPSNEDMSALFDELWKRTEQGGPST